MHAVSAPLSGAGEKKSRPALSKQRKNLRGVTDAAADNLDAQHTALAKQDCAREHRRPRQ